MTIMIILVIVNIVISTIVIALRVIDNPCLIAMIFLCTLFCRHIKLLSTVWSRRSPVPHAGVVH